MANRGVLRLEDISVAENQLYILASVDGLKFGMTFWYSFDLTQLGTVYGEEYMERVYFHIGAVHLMKLVGLRPATVVIDGKFAKHDTKVFRRFWSDLLVDNFGQWRYENNLPNFDGPSFTTNPVDEIPIPVNITLPSVKDDKSGQMVDTLISMSGGKDSLLAGKLLQAANIPHSIFSSFATYHGDHAEQSKRVDKVLPHCSFVEHYKLIIFDHYSQIPDGLIKKLADRTTARLMIPCCFVFSTLPIMLKFGYRYLVVANENSANVGNLKWPAEGGREINHQFCKSFAAEKLYNDYVRTVLVSNYHYYSILQPINDTVIFHLLRKHQKAVLCTHSCNVHPPWCKRCPKCCYIWLQFQACMSCEDIDDMFGHENLLDVEENLLFYRQMLELENMKPFECIGDFDEAKLAFELCYRKGLKGKAMEVFEKEVRCRGNFNLKSIVEKYTRIETVEHGLPGHVSDALMPLFKMAAEDLCNQLF